MDYAALVRQRAEEMGLDPDLAVRQMMAESGGNPNAVSSAGAIGLMQLMPATAQELGVDPRDPVQNIDGGLRYYKQMMDRFGDPRLALAAYNAGPGNVQKYGGVPPFKETQNYISKLMPVQTAQANTGTTNNAPASSGQSFNPSIDQILSALDKATAANDKEAIEELRSFAGPRFQKALESAKSAKDNEAVTEIQSIGSRYGLFQAPQVAPQAQPKDPDKPVTNFLKDVGLGAADALSFGFSDEAYAKAASALKGTNYEDELKAARSALDQAGAGKYVGQAASFLVPGIGAVRAAQGASRLARAGAGATTGAIQGAGYGAGSAEGGLEDRLEGAAVGGATGTFLGGTLGAVLPSSVRQEANKLIKGAGSNRAAAMDAEIIKDINKIAGGANQRGAPVGASQLNAVENKYVGDVTTALKNIGKPALEKAGLKADDISTALRDRRIISEAELNGLRSTKAGTALADAIEKAQRARSLTAPVPAATNPIARVGRAVLDLAPLPQPIRYVGQRILGSRQTREDVASKLVSDKTAKAADEVLSRTGPSAATQSLQRLQQQAQKATASAQAKQQVMQAQRAAQQAQTQATRNQVLAQTKTPLGGSFQELLPGGRAGTNLGSRDAISALRILRGQGGPVGDAAEQILKSRNVSDPNAFYGLQNQLRRLQESGVVPGSPVASQAASSGVRNPISYAEAVRTAGEAANLARSAAPSKELGMFATRVAKTTKPEDKAKLVSERLAKAADQAELDYLNQFVVPLTQFGAKGK